MKLIEKQNQHRRDFTGKYECEGCGHVKNIEGCYDDRNFHDNVAPSWKCEKCNKSTNDLGIEKEVVITKYAPYEVV